ncbi:hypothetical protein ACHAW5_009449 [Stephanodiscus triporus]|uniref:Uncharacterized protein n=1 Tax=Stephanodiscus triporus TaxID=2934178 RepID=A0ABD3QYA3_9STRA
MYSVRDLSTCLGAWNLNVSAKLGTSIQNPNISSPSDKRQKLNDTTAEVVGGGSSSSMLSSTSISSSKNAATAENILNDGNADTAFKFYYERSCPILLDTNHRSSCPPSAPLTLPFCVDDFVGDDGDVNFDDENLLPVVAGAIVLTYGADSKFTGGIGEEGVLTKVIVEFFFDEATVYKSDGNENKRGEGKAKDGSEEDEQKLQELDEDATVEAEELIFARSILGGEHESSSLIRAALCALSPFSPPGVAMTGNESSTSNSTSSSDDGIYIPTVWSGNTNRIYEYCLLGNLDDNLRELASKRLCVAIKKKKKDEQGGDSGPARGVCRITLTLSPASVLAKKKLMALEAAKGEDEENNIESLISTCSEVHRKIRQCLRILRPPKLITVSKVSGGDDMMGPSKRRRLAIRRESVTQLIDPALIVVGVRCKHQLLLDGDEAGKVYVNGALAVNCSESTSCLNQMSADALPAPLFGVDFTIPSVNGRYAIGSSGMPNKLVIEREYGALLVDALINAEQCGAGVARKLLDRLITGTFERANNSDDDDELLSMSISKDGYNDSLPHTERKYPIKFDNVSKPCLESIVLLSVVADPVGIGAKALGTKFRMQYGTEAFPCEVGTNEEYLLNRILGAQKIPKMVPRRARDVLLRGGYSSIDQMAKFLWVGGGGETWDGDHSDAMRVAEAMEGAMKLLRKVGCLDVMTNNVRLVSRKKLEPVVEQGVGDGDSAFTSLSKCRRSLSKLRCWYDSSSETYYVSDAIFFVEENHDGGDDEVTNASFEVDQNFVTAAKDSKSGSAKSPQPSDQQECDVIKAQISVEVEAEMSSIGVCDNEDGDVSAVAVKDNVDKEDKVSKAAGDDDDKGEDVVGAIKDDTSQNAKNMNVNTEKSINDTVTDNTKTDPDKTKRHAKGRTLRPVSAEDAAYLLAYYIAKEHPDVMVLERFVMCNRCERKRIEKRMYRNRDLNFLDEEFRVLRCEALRSIANDVDPNNVRYFGVRCKVGKVGRFPTQRYEYPRTVVV